MGSEVLLTLRDMLTVCAHLKQIDSDISPCSAS